MAKAKTVFVCRNCGTEAPKWIGKCPSCGEWNTFIEEVVVKTSAVAEQPISPGTSPVRLHEVDPKSQPRLDTQTGELEQGSGRRTGEGIGGVDRRVSPVSGNRRWPCRLPWR